MPYRLPSVPHLRLRFTLIAQKEAFLSSFKGSLLRGAFGHALRRTVCVMGPQQPCPTCMLRRQCSYPRLFETLIEAGEPVPRFLRGLPTAPRPYVFEPFDERRLYRSGDALEFDFLLFGQAIELYPYAIFAVSQMAEHGLGSKQIPFRLEKVAWQAAAGQSLVAAGQEASGQWRLLYDGATKRLLESPTAQPANEPPNGPTGQPRSSFLLNEGKSGLTLRFLTSTRLKFKNDLVIDFTFRMLVFKMLRRVLELAHFHVPNAEIDWEFHPLLVAADAVKFVEKDLQWLDWERRSNRQKTEMMMGGFVGKLVLEGDLAPFTELLRLCAVLHVGKGCVFGNGKIEVDFMQQKENDDKDCAMKASLSKHE